MDENQFIEMESWIFAEVLKEFKPSIRGCIALTG
jgi:hypothetical protein